MKSFLVSGLLVLAQPAADAARVAVIAVGDDPAAVGALHAEAQSRLDVWGDITVVPIAEVAAAAGVTEQSALPVMAADAAKKADELLALARRAYARDRGLEAINRLNQLTALYSRQAYVPVSRHVDLQVWRAASFLALRDRKSAEAAARDALILSPELSVDVKAHRPSVIDLIERVRARGLETATIEVKGAPAGATFTVDEREVSAVFSVPMGLHTLNVSAPGFGRVLRQLDVQENRTIIVDLPVAIDPMVRATLEQVLWRQGTETASEARRMREELNGIAAKTNSRAIALLITRTDPPATTAMVFVPGEASLIGPLQEPDGTFRIDGLPEAVGDVLRGRATIVPKDPTAWLVTPKAEIEIASRSRTVAGADGGGLSMQFAGTGPRIGVSVNKGPIAGSVDAAFLFYQLSPVTITLPNSQTTSINGGTTISARVAGGYDHRLNPSLGFDSPVLYGRVGAWYRRHDAEDVNDATGPLGVFPSWDHFGVDLTVGADLPLWDKFLPRGETRLNVQFGIAPYSAWTERPTGLTGTSGAPSPSIFANIALTWKPRGRWNLSATYRTELHQVVFEGIGNTPLQPALRNARWRETVHGFGVAVRREF